MSMPKKTARELYDDFIKTDWPKLFQEGGEITVRRSDGARYVPVKRNIDGLKDDVNAWDWALAVYDQPTTDSSAGYDRIVDQAGPEWTWEGFLIDPTRPWASEVPKHVRENVENYLGGVVQAVHAARQAEAEEVERLAREEDERIIALMQENRVQDGKPPWTVEQLAGVRERRRAARKAT
jgi:hypothetical protein